MFNHVRAEFLIEPVVFSAPKQLDIKFRKAGIRAGSNRRGRFQGFGRRRFGGLGYQLKSRFGFAGCFRESIGIGSRRTFCHKLLNSRSDRKVEIIELMAES